MEGGVEDPARGRSLFSPALEFVVPDTDDATDGADELNDLGSGRAEGRTVCTDIISFVVRATNNSQMQDSILIIISLAEFILVFYIVFQTFNLLI